MTKLQFTYACAYADVYDMLDMPLEEVWKLINSDLEDLHEYDEEGCYFQEGTYMETFLEFYNSMNEYNLSNEVKGTMKSTGWDFITACLDWDL